MDIDAKLRPIYLINILKERTDEDHYLTTSQLCSILKTEYGMETHRTTIKSDIEMLQQAGIDIKAERSTQNQYKYVDRDFDNAELKLLIDAVMSAKFITKEKSDQLVAKLTALAGLNKARELKRNLIVDGRNKLENEQILLIVDAINDAINQRRKIKFQKVEYNVRRERVLHHGGETYTFSPYSLVWDGDFYYVVGFSDKYQSIGSHRVDRIYQQPKILDEAAVPAPVGFDVNKYINTMYHMFSSERRTVELICDNSLMDAIIDRFGENVVTYAYDMENFRADVEVAVNNVFFSWIVGFGGLVKIKYPDEVKGEYAKFVTKAYDALEKKDDDSDLPF